MGASQTKQVGEIQNLSREQQTALSELFGALQPGEAAGRLASPEAAGAFFEEAIQAPQVRQFQQDILPQIQEQFAGATSGSGFNRALGTALSDFESNLAAQRAGFQQQAQGQQLDLLRSLLGVNAVTPIVEEGQPGLLSALGGIAGTTLGKFGGKFGSTLGDTLASKILS